MQGSGMTSILRVRFLFVVFVSLLTMACQKSDTSTTQKSSVNTAQTQISQAWLEKSVQKRLHCSTHRAGERFRRQSHLGL